MILPGPPRSIMWRADSTADQVGAADVDAHNFVEGVLLQFHDEDAVAARAGTGVVDQDVDLAELAEGVGHHGIDLGAVGDVVVQAGAAAAHGLDLLDHAGEALPAVHAVLGADGIQGCLDVGYHDVGSF